MRTVIAISTVFAYIVDVSSERPRASGVSTTQTNFVVTVAETFVAVLPAFVAQANGELVFTS